MQYFKDQNAISEDEFALLFPDEANILKYFINDNENNIEHKIQLEIKGEKIYFKYKEFSSFHFQAKDKLLKHQQFFFKNSPYKDLLARAMGLKSGKKKPIVLDASAGALGDSMLMYSYGLEKLYLVERHPLIAALILNALREIDTAKIEFYFGEVSNFINEKYDSINGSASSFIVNYDIAFYDPMYEAKNMKAAPKKEMFIFREIIRADQDNVEIAKQLLNNCNDRLVIKRSNKAKPLLPHPCMCVKGKSTSYDVYLKRA